MKSVTTSGYDVNSYERKRYCLKDLNLPVQCSTIGPMFFLMYIYTPSTMDDFMFLVFRSLLLFFLFRDRSHAFSRRLFPDWPIAEVTVERYCQGYRPFYIYKPIYKAPQIYGYTPPFVCLCMCVCL